MWFSRPPITPGKLYRKEGLSESADGPSLRTRSREQLVEAGSAPLLRTLPTTSRQILAKKKIGNVNLQLSSSEGSYYNGIIKGLHL